MNYKNQYGRRFPSKEPTLDTPLNRINQKIKKFIKDQNGSNQRIIEFYDIGRLVEPYPSVIDEYTRLLRIKSAIQAGEDELLAYLIH